MKKVISNIITLTVKESAMKRLLGWIGICLLIVGCGGSEEDFGELENGKAENITAEPCGKDAVGNERYSAARLVDEDLNTTFGAGVTLDYSSQSLEDENDVDWYTFKLEDSFNGSPPKIRAWLTDVPGSADYAIEISYSCDSGDTSITCSEEVDTVNFFETPLIQRGPSCSYFDNTIFSAWMDCDGLNDSGTVWIKVYSTSWVSVCQNYTLHIESI